MYHELRKRGTSGYHSKTKDLRPLDRQKECSLIYETYISESGGSRNRIRLFARLIGFVEQQFSETTGRISNKALLTWLQANAPGDTVSRKTDRHLCVKPRVLLADRVKRDNRRRR